MATQMIVAPLANKKKKHTAWNKSTDQQVRAHACAFTDRCDVVKEATCPPKFVSFCIFRACTSTPITTCRLESGCGPHYPSKPWLRQGYTSSRGTQAVVNMVVRSHWPTCPATGKHCRRSWAGLCSLGSFYDYIKLLFLLNPLE